MIVCVPWAFFPAFPNIVFSHAHLVSPGTCFIFTKSKKPFLLASHSHVPVKLVPSDCLWLSLLCSLVFLFRSPPAPLYTLSHYPRFLPAESLSSKGNDCWTLECFARGRVKNKTLKLFGAVFFLSEGYLGGVSVGKSRWKTTRLVVLVMLKSRRS